jgi:uncharacterized protein (TIGR02246 family)
MRAFMSAAIVVVAVTGSASAGPKEDALAVVESWTKAFEASDVDGISKLYAPDATFFGTGSKTLVNNPEGIREYFGQLRTNMPRSATVKEPDVMLLSDTTFVVTGLDNVSQTRDGQKVSATGRTTFIVAKRGADWKIVHFHRSAMPN